jgi:hypothetical protein
MNSPASDKPGLLVRFAQTAIVVAGLILMIAGAAHAGTAKPHGPGARRIALVVGNSNYRYVATLTNPDNDARLVARTLRSLGFTLMGGRAQTDLNRLAFDQAIEQFGDRIRGADVALFYYAGHGLRVRGSNYLVPIDANPTRESEVDLQMVDSESILGQMEDAKTHLNIIILDACRNNPFAGRGLRAIGGGLAQMHAPEGTLISYATQPGSVASDGDKGDSPFTLALVHSIQQPGFDLFHTFNQVGLEVERETDGEQQPWVSSSPITVDFYFAGAPEVASTAASIVPDPEVVFWQSIERSRNAADYQAYLDTFPNGRFAILARSRLALYQSRPLPSAEPTSLALRTQSTGTPSAKSSKRPSHTASNEQATQLASAETVNPNENPGARIAGSYIELGETLDKADADLLAKRFERFGYHPSVVGSGSGYSLKFGPYAPGQAKAVRMDLMQHWDGLTFHLLVNSKTGELMSQSEAQTAAALITRLGANPSIIARQVSGQSRYLVEIGPYVTQKEAIRAGETLGQKYSDSLNCTWGDCDWQYTWDGVPPKLLCPNPGAACRPD